MENIARVLYLNNKYNKYKYIQMTIMVLIYKMIKIYKIK